MKKVSAIIVILSISFSAFAENKSAGALACTVSQGVEICRDRSANSIEVQFEGKSIRFICEKDISSSADYSVRIIAGRGDVTMFSSKDYAFTDRLGTHSTKSKKLRDGFPRFCGYGIIVNNLAYYITGNLYRDVESNDVGRIAFFFSRVDGDN